MLKKRFVIDFEVFNLMLRELRLIKKELRNLKQGGGSTASAKVPAAKREISDKVYTPDVLKKLKITAATLISYEKQGLLTYHKEGRNKVYSEAEVMAFKKLKGRGKRLKKATLAAVKGGK
jgi:hypothetical protein